MANQDWNPSVLVPSQLFSWSVMCLQSQGICTYMCGYVCTHMHFLVSMYMSPYAFLYVSVQAHVCACIYFYSSAYMLFPVHEYSHVHALQASEFFYKYIHMNLSVNLGREVEERSVGQSVFSHPQRLRMGGQDGAREEEQSIYFPCTSARPCLVSCMALALQDRLPLKPLSLALTQVMSILDYLHPYDGPGPSLSYFDICVCVTL